MRTNYLMYFLFTLNMIVSCNSFADEIHMKNGDRISGVILKKEGNTLELKTKYADKITVQWNEVANIKTDELTTVVLDDQTKAHAVLSPSEKGNISLTHKDQTTSSVALSRISLINPAPTETGNKIKLNGRINFGYNAINGNTDTEKLNLDTEIIARTLENRYTAGAEMNREKDGGTETASSKIGYLKIDHFINKKWFLYAASKFTKDRFKDLDLRSSIGGGAGYQFYESGQINLSLEAGLSYVNEDFLVANDDDFSALRWAIKYDQQLYKDSFQIFHEHEGMQGLESSADIIVLSKTGIRVPLIKNLNATAQVNADWDNSPAPGKERMDQTYLLSVGYHW